MGPECLVFLSPRGEILNYKNQKAIERSKVCFTNALPEKVKSSFLEYIDLIRTFKETAFFLTADIL